MTRMTMAQSERRKKRIARKLERKKKINRMKLGLPFNTEEGQKYQLHWEEITDEL